VSPNKRPTNVSALMVVLLIITLIFSVSYSGIGTARADSVIAAIRLGPFPYSVAFNPNNKDMYVVNQVGGGNNSTVSVIDSSTNHVVDTITVGIRSTDIAFNPNNRDMYVTNLESNTVSVIDSSNHVVNTIHVGKGPESIAFNPTNGNMYVPSGGVFGNNTVSVIDTSTNHVIAAIRLGPFPYAVAFNPNNETCILQMPVNR
jgi:YVTN family beta-propeller protein